MSDASVRRRKRRKSRRDGASWLSANRQRINVAAAFVIACAVAVMLLQALQGFAAAQSGP